MERGTGIKSFHSRYSLDQSCIDAKRTDRVPSIAVRGYLYMYLGIYPCGKSYIFLLLDEQRERKWEKHVFFAWAIRIFKFRLNNSLPKISQNDTKKFEKKKSKGELLKKRTC